MRLAINQMCFSQYICVSKLWGGGGGLEPPEPPPPIPTPTCILWERVARPCERINLARETVTDSIIRDWAACMPSKSPA